MGKEKKAKDLSEEEKQQMEKLKNDIVTKKAELKAEGQSGGQINKNTEIVEWVAKLNALKEKEAQLKGSMTEKDVKKEMQSKKGDEKEIAKLRDDIDAYKLKLKEEFGYSKQDINKDPDLVEMQARYREWAASELIAEAGSLCGSPPRTRWQLMSDLGRSSVQQH